MTSVAAARKWMASRANSQTEAAASRKTEARRAAWHAARLKREQAEAAKSELELEAMRGTLGDREAMADEYVTHVIAARQLLEAIPDRIAPLLAAETSEHECRRLLHDEIAQVCAELSRPALGRVNEPAQ
jgi:phage terminase Nu1 subunit (DNA packaging protein)